eukprot:TRINITY_DN72107_c0_g1_i1.p1 TRINITY_DN72107_c0_g1~~TRINITY_DN72107_c0_g1_i1.p1  ORF type:complete len:552 (+),score=71.84 TRINITY_DN72107_c0_g1_i1:65-1657(+)
MQIRNGNESFCAANASSVALVTAASCQAGSDVLFARSLEVKLQSKEVETVCLRLSALRVSQTINVQHDIYSAKFGIEIHDTVSANLALQCDTVDITMKMLSEVEAPQMVPRLELGVSLGMILLDTSECFLSACLDIISDLSDICSSVSAKSVRFDSRPYVLVLHNAVVHRVSGSAQRLGVRPGHVLCGVDPEPPDGDVLRHISTCQLPATFLFCDSPFAFAGDVRIDACSLFASRLEAKRVVNVTLQRREVKLPALELRNWRGTVIEAANRAKAFYHKALLAELPWLALAIRVEDQTLDSAAAGSFGSALAWAKFGGAAAGAVGTSLGTSGAKLIRASAAQGKLLRNARPESKYSFGDVTRGFLALARSRGRAIHGEFQDIDDADPITGSRSSTSAAAAEVLRGSAAGAQEYVQRERVVQSTVGMYVGASSVGSAAGPVGYVVGSSVGGMAGRNLSQAASSASQAVASVANEGAESRGGAQGEGYRFGDLTRGISSRGRQSRGGQAQGEYKFGDFSRGLFSAMSGRKGNG